MDRDYERVAVADRKVVMREVDKGDAFTFEPKPENGLLRESIRAGFDRHDPGRAADLGPEQGRLFWRNEDREAVFQDGGQVGEETADIAADSESPYQAGVERDPDGRWALLRFLGMILGKATL